jgi:hypothetical protein
VGGEKQSGEKENKSRTKNRYDNGGILRLDSSMMHSLSIPDQIAREVRPCLKPHRPGPINESRSLRPSSLPGIPSSLWLMYPRCSCILGGEGNRIDLRNVVTRSANGLKQSEGRCIPRYRRIKMLCCKNPASRERTRGIVGPSGRVPRGSLLGRWFLPRSEVS